jgi:FkbM family methyltransferase
MIAAMAQLADLMSRARMVGELAAPTALAEALQARRAFRQRGASRTSLRSYRNAWRSRLHLLPPGLDLTRGVVVDIGANEGNFSAAVLALAPTATVLAVEPSPGPRARLEARFSGQTSVTVVPDAVAATAGTAVFNITEHDHNSSLHAPLDTMRELYHDPGWNVAERIEVPTTTLDDLVGDREVAALKIDVQGAELDVIAGGENALQRTAAVLMEVTFVSHYEGDATFQLLNTAMVERGFDLIALSEPGWSPEGVATWSDACYARRAATSA